MAALAALMLALLPAARAEPAPPVLNGTDHGQPVYQTSIGQDCSVSIRLEQQRPAGNFISLRHTPLSCRPTVTDEAAAIARLLASLTGDGIGLRDLKTFALGRVTPPAWKQQVADCFLKNRDGGDRRAPPPGPALAQMLAGCKLFAELNDGLEEFGVRLAISGIEKVETVNLENVDLLRKEGIAEEWINARKANHDHGIVPLGGFIYFRIAPYP